MTDWLRNNPLTGFGAVAGAVLAVGAAWATFELPVPATRSWVSERISPFREDSMSLLLVRRELLHTQIFQWEHNNPVPRSIDAHLTIQRLRDELADVERRIAARR